MIFKDRHILVTGAAGHLGRAACALFRERGARLTMVDRDTGPLRAGGFDRSQLVSLDLMDRLALSQSVDAAVQACGPVDALCHLAGGFRMGDPVHETSDATWDFLMDINARAFVNVASAVVPHMLSRKGGSIVCIGAGAASKGAANMGAYAASKSALVRLVEAMSAELREQGINVNCVLPSIIDTPDNRLAMPDADNTRWVAPADLAEVIAFLASPAARAIHGAAVPVTGLV